MEKTITTIVGTIDKTNEAVGKATSWLNLVMVLLTFVIVVMRYLFNQGNIAMQESVVYMYAFVFMLGAGYTFLKDGHVRVDIFYKRRTPVGQAWINLIGGFTLLLPTCGFIFFVSLPYVLASWSLFEGSVEVGGLNLVYILKTVILLMAFLLALQGVSSMLKSYLVISGKSTPEKPNA